MSSDPIVVVGGGAAGIACACSLAEHGHHVTLIEQGPRLGGRAGSFSHPTFGDLDAGLHILMRCCTEATALLQRLGVGDDICFQSSLEVPIATHDVPRPTRARIASAPLPSPLNLLPSLLRYRPLSAADRIRVLPAALALWLRSPKGGETFATWLRRRAQSEKMIARFWDPVSIAALNASASTVDTDAAGKVFRDAFLSPHGADLGFFRRPLSKLFGAAIPYIERRGGTVLLRTQVRSIETRTGRCIGVRLPTGERIRASSVVAAVPPAQLATMLSNTPEQHLPQDIHNALNLRWAPIVNLNLRFDRPVMQKEQPFFIGVDGPIQAVFDVSAIRRESVGHHVVLSQSDAHDLISLSDVEILNSLLDPLKRLLPTTSTARLRGWFASRWRQATFVPEPGSNALRPQPCSAIPQLHLAGDWVETEWPSTIEGAVRAGLSAAKCVLNDCFANEKSDHCA